MNTRILQRKLVRPIGAMWGNGTCQKIKALKCYATTSSIGTGIFASSALMAGYHHSMWACAGLTCLTLLSIKLSKVAKRFLSKTTKTSDFKIIAGRFNKIFNKQVKY